MKQTCSSMSLMDLGEPIASLAESSAPSSGQSSGELARSVESAFRLTKLQSALMFARQKRTPRTPPY